MSVFLGIGLGPIQTGIFLSGACRGGFKRIVVAEVDQKLGDAVNKSGGKISINIAGASKVYQEEISGIEVYSPITEDGRKALVAAAAEADELATALPSVKFFSQVAPWLREGFLRDPKRQRLIYAAENHNHAAELLHEALGTGLDSIHCLNTVVGKMSGVVPAADCASQKLALLCPGADRGHLVEEFNRILISTAPGAEMRKTLGLHVKPDLLPFEEAKLYGHNAIHFLLGMLAREAGLTFMNELSSQPSAISFAHDAFVNESGAALCKKWLGVDELFTTQGFHAYAEDLLVRMLNPFLKDAVERVTRDLGRKLAWDDRVIGTMRVALSQGVEPKKLARGAALSAAALWGKEEAAIRSGCQSLWPTPWTSEHETLLRLMLEIR
ncbi:MAG: hypothetical protein A2X49_13700 [Lentisphaerae bacterium GWF2_52_8]|nr:MAG: hypothetical protein A2X49_13700 [Lentisphaerae bacterium GWF2_52_8]